MKTVSQVSITDEQEPSQPVTSIATSIPADKTRLKIAIALCTRERPRMLQCCLTSLLALDIPDGVEAVAIIVENSETPYCEGLASDFARQAPSALQIVYVQERELGIPIARNRSIDVALDLNADWIAFIDDDEEVDPGWLAALVNCRHDADVLQGPVHYLYGRNTPDWIITREMKNRATGTRLDTAFTNNVMMKAVIARSGMRFDTSMRFTGGSDSDFFHRVADAGWVVRWVNEAKVTEVVLPNRMTLRWQLERAMRVAANATRSHANRKGLGSAFFKHGPKGLRRMVRGVFIGLAGVALLPFSSRLGKRASFAGLRDISSGAGSILEFLGASPQPYTKIDGA